MKKKSYKFKNEIDLVDILKAIFNEKYKIFLILLISILIGVFYNMQKPEIFKISLNIKNAKSTEFTNFLPIYNVLYEDLINPKKKKNKLDNNLITIKELMLDRFINELSDYEELILILSNNEEIKKEISALSSKDKEQILYNYAKSLSIDKPKKDNAEYILTYYWHNLDEAKDILNELLNLVSSNLNERIYKELNDLIIIRERSQSQKDSIRIEFLTEQSLIAKELNIEFNQIDSVNLPAVRSDNDDYSQSNISLNVNRDNFNTYYLKGFKIIDKEIELIKNRKQVDSKNIKLNVNNLKNENINWVEFNINYINVVNQKKTKFNLIIAIFIGFVISLFYIFLVTLFRSLKLIR